MRCRVRSGCGAEQQGIRRGHYLSVNKGALFLEFKSPRVTWPDMQMGMETGPWLRALAHRVFGLQGQYIYLVINFQ